MSWGQQYVGHPFLAAMLTLGWIPVACSIVAVDPAEATTLFLVGQALACLMVVVAPFDVWYYDERLLPGFFADIDDTVTEAEDETLRRLAERFDTIYSRYWWVTTLPWVALVLLVFVLGQGYFASQGITSQVERTAYLGFFVYWLVFVGLRTHGGLVTVLTIRAFARDVDLEIDPLHPDGLGGLSTIGRFAIRMTLVISLGSLALPLSFQIASHIRYENVVYVGVALFVLLVALNFLYPTYKVNRRAQDLRENMLESRRRRIRSLEARLSESRGDGGDDTADDLLQLEIQRARREYDEYQNVQLYPLSIGIITRLASSILLPIFFILFEFFVSGFL
ncbi:hypothetical protein ACFQJD_13275 [Haloplanus sp. GCM10025708]|uniref:hypothetical protein n=1 Tax=Haloferacaceae TaxID=1644056 RepID=UPI00361416F1